MTCVFIVVRRNKDMLNHMVEIMRVCTSREVAEKVREEIWESVKVETTIQAYIVDVGEK